MKYMKEEVDVLVVGAGHAGIEAACVCAKLKKKTMLLTLSLDKIANMPCNPSIGGTAKGHLVRELDALGGVMGKIADLTTIQSKILNSKRGPAVRSLRAQIDKTKYFVKMKNYIETRENLFLKQDELVKIDVKDGEVVGAYTKYCRYIKTKAIIIACGTYLKSKTFVGEVSSDSGPDGMPSSIKLSDSLKKIGVELRRFKTGTPARVNKKSIDFSKLEIQEGDKLIHKFSFKSNTKIENKIVCFKAHTNEKTHDIILKNLDRSPLYSGVIEGVGPRYCPSIEDKVVRFKDKDRHAIFVEPMGLETNEMYLQGMSSSLPLDVQISFLKTIAGFEKIEVMRPAYAIEYDCCNPISLKKTLEFKKIKGLYGAGQFNGTSGYEEAAVLGFVAGVNAALKIDGKEEFILSRSSSYIGTLIDDLTTKGCNEPYRMMTARSEYRLLLRHDNADERLCDIAYKLNTITKDEYEKFLEKRSLIEKEKERLKGVLIKPTAELNRELEKRGTTKIDTPKKFIELIKRPQVDFDFLEKFDVGGKELLFEIKEQIEIDLKYSEFIEKQQNKVIKQEEIEKIKLKDCIDYEKIEGLRKEAREKLNEVKPVDLGQALRISGVNPADISVLMIYLKQKREI